MDVAHVGILHVRATKMLSNQKMPQQGLSQDPSSDHWFLQVLLPCSSTLHQERRQGMERRQGRRSSRSWAANVEGFLGVCARVAAGVQSRCFERLDRGVVIPGMPLEIVPVEALAAGARRAMGPQQPRQTSSCSQDPYARLGLRPIVEGKPQPPLTRMLQPSDLGGEPEEPIEEITNPDESWTIPAHYGDGCEPIVMIRLHRRDIRWADSSASPLLLISFHDTQKC